MVVTHDKELATAVPPQKSRSPTGEIVADYTEQAAKHTLPAGQTVAPRSGDWRLGMGVLWDKVWRDLWENKAARSRWC